MAFPSNLGAVQENLNDAWTRSRDIAGTVKTETTTLKAQSLAGILTSSQILSYSTLLADMKIQLVAIAALGAPLAAYAQAAINNNTINIATEFSNMVSAIDGVTAWIIANFPKTVTTNELRAKMFAPDNTGRTVDVVFSAGATANLRTTLDTLLAAIN